MPKRILPIFILTLLTACQAVTGVSERPLNNPDRRLKESAPAEEILPSLQIDHQGKFSALQLRSQTARYLNSQNSELEIVLSSSQVAFCKNQKPGLEEDLQALHLIIKSKNPKTPIAIAEYVKNPKYILTATLETPSGKKTFSAESFQTFKITDLNNAIVRGHLALAAKDISIEGEYFTAICRS